MAWATSAGASCGERMRSPRLTDVPQQADLVVDFVQMPVPLVDREGRDLPDQRDHRRAHPIRGEQRRGRIQQPGAGHHGEGLRLAGGQRGAERHVGRGLLMPRVDDADAVAGLLRGIEQMIVVDAGEGVKRVDAVLQQALDHRFGGRHAGHRRDRP